MRKSSLLASALAAALVGATPAPANIALASQPGAGHRRSAPGPTNALKIRRAARKVRNVKVNQRNHRG